MEDNPGNNSNPVNTNTNNETLSNTNPNSPSYLHDLLKKYEYIQGLWITDYEGALISSSIRNEEEEKQNDIDNKNNKIKVSLSYQLNSTMDQIAKIEKWKTKYLVTIYDTMTIFQARVNKSALIHLTCDSKGFNYEVMKEIVSEVQDKFQKIEKELDNLTLNNENN